MDDWHELPKRTPEVKYKDLPMDGDIVDVKKANGKIGFGAEFVQDAPDNWGFGDRSGVGRHGNQVVAWRHH